MRMNRRLKLHYIMYIESNTLQTFEYYVAWPCKYMAVFLSHVPCKVIPSRTSELNDALSWSGNIEEYYHELSCVSRLLRCRAGPKLDRQGFLLPRTRPHDLRASFAAVRNPCPGDQSLQQPLGGAVVNDRGPFIKGRIIDVSTGAADVLGFRWAGLARVTVETGAD